MKKETNLEQAARMIEGLFETYSVYHSGAELRKKVLFEVRGVARISDEELVTAVDEEYKKYV